MAGQALLPPGAAVGPGRSPLRGSHSQCPRLSPGRPSPAPRSHPGCGRTCLPGRSPAQGSGYFGRTPRPPSRSARTPPSPEVHGREAPGTRSAASPAPPALSRPPRPLRVPLPQQQFEAGQAPRDGSGPGAPSPAAGVRPAQSAAAWTPQPLPSAPRPPLPDHQLPPPRRRPPRPPRAPGQPEPHTHPRPPSGPRAARLQPGPGWGGWSAPLLRALPPGRPGSRAFLRGAVRRAVPGRVGRATAARRSARPRPAPRAGGSAPPCAPVAGAAGSSRALPPRSAECTPRPGARALRTSSGSAALLTRFSAALPAAPAPSACRLPVCEPRRPLPVPLPF